MTESRNALLPILIAAGSGLAATQAAALELGEAQVKSTLGQPLRASIAFALGPNEQLSDYCVTLAPARPSAGMPVLTAASINVANGVINVTGSTVNNEPLIGMRVSVSCPYAPKLTREYTLFVDPAGTAENASVAANVTAAPVPQTVQVNRPVTDTPRREVPRQLDIATTSQYRVQPGDSLSKIAERIQNRGVDLWSAIAQIHAANPQAFVDGDPNKLMAGVVLAIPAFSPQASFVPAATSTRVASVETRPVESPDTEQVVRRSPGMQVTSVEPASADTPLTEINIVDVQVSPPALRSPNVPVATIQPSSDNQAQQANSLWWMIGGGLALLGGLLFYARRPRTNDLPEPVEAKAVHPLRRASDTATVETIVADDYDIDDDSPTSENLLLDADLELGTGLGGGADIAVTEDFGFDTSADLDLEFPAEVAGDSEPPVTDIIAAPRIEASSILDSEILPDDEDYDLSVIMDATRMPDTNEVTERDLKAVMVDSGDETQIQDNYTISSDIDYQVLEQDYEDELSATQALNMEIEKAAAELADRLDRGDVEIADESVITKNLEAARPLATVTHLDPAARSLAANDADDASLTDTVEGLVEDDISFEDKTTELPAPGQNKAS